MQTLKDKASLAVFLESTGDEELKRLITQRVADLCEYEGFELGELVHFYILESDLELELLRLNKPPEIIEEHSRWTEFVYVLSDDGFGLEVFVKK